MDNVNSICKGVRSAFDLAIDDVKASIVHARNNNLLSIDDKTMKLTINLIEQAINAAFTKSISSIQRQLGK